MDVDVNVAVAVVLDVVADAVVCLDDLFVQAHDSDSLSLYDHVQVNAHFRQGRQRGTRGASLPALAAATAATAAATPAEAAAATTAAAATAATPLLGLLHGNRTSLHVLAVDLGHRLLGLLVARH